MNVIVNRIPDLIITCLRITIRILIIRKIWKKVWRPYEHNPFKHATTDELICLDGHDQSEPHPRVLDIIEDANRITGDRYLQSTFTDYVAEVKKKIKDLQVKYG